MKALMQVAFVGFGEAASAFVAGWGGAFSDKISAYDLKTAHEETRPAKCADYKAAGIRGCLQLKEALADAGCIFSLVTADQAASAAHSVSKVISTGQFYLDCNSCSPETKRENARIIEAAGGLYVDVAVMAPVHPGLHQTPLLLCGPHAQAALDALSDLSMNMSIMDGDIGSASSLKMIRSIMIKGLEALNAECVLAARKAGVEPALLASLEQTFPGFDWVSRSPYMLERMMRHGVRRAAEMREVVSTIESAGLKSSMSKATVEWQQLIGSLNIEPDCEQLDILADRVLQRLDGVSSNKNFH